LPFLTLLAFVHHPGLELGHVDSFDRSRVMGRLHMIIMHMIYVLHMVSVRAERLENGQIAGLIVLLPGRTDLEYRVWLL